MDRVCLLLAGIDTVIDVRVVNASAVPMLTPRHSQAMVYVLAEKIAADVLAGK
jgi:hypothetical protein